MASNRTSVPPSVGARSIDANNIPGTRTSSPYSARPETIGWVNQIDQTWETYNPPEEDEDDARDE